MAISIFSDKTEMPNSSMVAVALADAYALWDELQEHVKTQYPNVVEEWKHYGKTAGWCFKLISKKRNLLFLIPLNGYFRIRIVLSEKAAICSENTKIPNEIKKAIQTATSYAEGRSIDIDINRREQLKTIKNLLKIKHEN
jgi:hypothetical protein